MGKWYRRKNFDSKAEYAKKMVAGWTRQAMSDPCFAGEDNAEILLLHLTRWPLKRPYDNRYPEWLEYAKSAPVAGWFKSNLQGEVEYAAAWKARGSGWASEVTPEGWKEFRKHMELSADNFREAMKQRPRDPFAPWQLFSLSVAHRDPKDPMPKDWFEKTIAIRFDYEPAYGEAIRYLQPRWGGSHQEMLQFGEQCLATGRFDTGVPRVYQYIVESIYQDRYPERRGVFMEKTVAQNLIKMHEGYLTQMHSAYAQREERSLAAVHAWMGGLYAEAAGYHQQLDHQITGKQALAFIEKSGLDRREIISESVLMASPRAREFSRAEELYRKGYFKEALPIYEKVAAALAEIPGADYLPRQRAAMAALSEQLKSAKDEWVPVPCSKDLVEWKIVRGHWEGNEAGGIVNQGRDRRAYMVLPLPMGKNYEIRCQVDFFPGKCCKGLGLLVNVKPEDSRFHMAGCIRQYMGSNSTHAQITQMSFFPAKAPLIPATLQKTGNKLRASFNDGLISMAVGDTPMITDYKPTETEMPSKSPDYWVGIGADDFCSENTTTITAVEIRKISKK